MARKNENPLATWGLCTRRQVAIYCLLSGRDVENSILLVKRASII